MSGDLIRKVKFRNDLVRKFLKGTPGPVSRDTLVKLAGKKSSTDAGVALTQSVFEKPMLVEQIPKPSPMESGALNGSIKIIRYGFRTNTANLVGTQVTSGSPLDGIEPDIAKSARRRRNPDITCIDDPNKIRDLRAQARLMGRKIGLVPTMGALHDGHLKMIRNAACENSEVYVSIYVNPTQFGVNEDLQNYPKPWEEDLKKLNHLNKLLIDQPGNKGLITTIFKPSTEAMYPTLPPTSEPDGYGSFVTVTPLANALEGASRPVFFRGVATVVMKLLNIVQPDQVYFGQKDIQQLLVVRRMMKDFHVNTSLRVASTARDRKDGLALSSRNVYLGDRRRAVAPVLYKALTAGYQAMAHEGKLTRQDILGPAIEVAARAQRAQRKLPPSQRVRFEIDYLSLADPETLEELQAIETDRSAILSGAMVMLPLEHPQSGENTGVGDGKLPVRLIDNVIYLKRNLFQ